MWLQSIWEPLKIDSVKGISAFYWAVVVVINRSPEAGIQAALDFRGEIAVA